MLKNKNYVLDKTFGFIFLSYALKTGQSKYILIFVFNLKFVKLKFDL